ncbi:Ldh family oxidoreductase [bacterium]|nr:Ldh family oxidoreductase [bacterium]
MLKGLIDPSSPFKTVRETPSTLLIDGGNGLGMVVSHHAMLSAIEKARQNGVAFVNVRNSNHYGIAGYYAMMALPHDMIGISFTNAQPLVVPTYGRTRLIGTNPIAVAAPALNERPYVLDMATSIVPIGKITVYDKAGESIPEGWGVDKTGAVTTSPSEVLKGGALLPLGGSDIMRGYKGYGLGLMVDIFSGVLSGAAFGPEVGAPGRDAPANVGHFFAAVNIGAFRDPLAFKSDLDSLIHTLKDAPKAVGQERIYIHGEKEFELFERNSREGVPLLLEVVKGLKEAGEQVGVPFDLQAVAETTGEEE